MGRRKTATAASILACRLSSGGCAAGTDRGYHACPVGGARRRRRDPRGGRLGGRVARPCPLPLPRSATLGGSSAAFQMRVVPVETDMGATPHCDGQGVVKRTDTLGHSDDVVVIQESKRCLAILGLAFAGRTPPHEHTPASAVHYLAHVVPESDLFNLHGMICTPVGTGAKCCASDRRCVAKPRRRRALV